MVSKRIARVKDGEACLVSNLHVLLSLALRWSNAEQTALAGRIEKELKCHPVDNLNFRRVMDCRAKREKEKKTTGFDRGVVSTATGTVGQGVGSSFDTFIVSPYLLHYDS